MPALRSYGASGPQSARDLRDALITGGLERDAQHHNDFDTAFGGQQIDWGMRVQVRIDDPREDGANVLDKVHLAVTGGGYNCEVTDEHQQDTPHDLTGTDLQWYGTVVPGPLDWTWQDDCLTAGGNASADGSSCCANSIVWIAFPYPGPDRNAEPIEVKASYVCKDKESDGNPADAHFYRCTSDRRVDVDVTHGLGVGTQQQSQTTVLDATPKAVVTFTPGGDCTVVSADCSGRP
jgi:hypothetical protein